MSGEYGGRRYGVIVNITSLVIFAKYPWAGGSRRFGIYDRITTDYAVYYVPKRLRFTQGYVRTVFIRAYG